MQNYFIDFTYDEINVFENTKFNLKHSDHLDSSNAK